MTTYLGRQQYALLHPCESGKPLREGHKRRYHRFITSLSCTPSEAHPLWIVTVALASSNGGMVAYRSWVPEKRTDAMNLAEALLDGVGIEGLTRVEPWTAGINVVRPMLAAEQIAAGFRPYERMPIEPAIAREVG